MTTRLELVSRLITVSQTTGNPLAGDPLEEEMEPLDDDASSITVSFLGDQRTKPVTPAFTVTFFGASPLTCMLSIYGILDLEVETRDVVEVAQALSQGVGVYFEHVKARKWPLPMMRSMTVLGYVTVRVPGKEYRVTLPMPGRLVPGLGNYPQWAMSLPQPPEAR